MYFLLGSSSAGVPNLGDASPWGDVRGSQVVVFWVQLDQWGDVIDVWGDGEAKRLGTPDLVIKVKTCFNEMNYIKLN